MPKFYKFKTACFSKEDFIDTESLGIEVEQKLLYKDLPINLNAIAYYYPLRAVELGKRSDATPLPEDEVWFDAKFVLITLLDGTELTINMNIQDFEILVNE